MESLDKTNSIRSTQPRNNNTKSQINKLHWYLQESCPKTSYINNISFVDRLSLWKVLNSENENIKTVGIICPAHTYEWNGDSFELFHPTYQNKFHSLTECVQILQHCFSWQLKLELEFVFADLWMTLPKNVSADQHITTINKQKEIYYQLLNKTFSSFSYTSFQEQWLKIPLLYDNYTWDSDGQQESDSTKDIQLHSKYLGENYNNALIIKDGITDTNKKPYLEGDHRIQLYNCFVDIRTLPHQRTNR